MACSDEDRGRSRRPDAEDWGWSHGLGTQWPGGREVGWRRVRSAPGTWRLGAQVSWLSLKTEVDGLLVVWPQNHWDDFSSVWASKLMATVCELFGLKTTRTVFAGLTSKLVVTVSSGLASKPAVIISSSWASKPVVTISSGLASKPAATVFAGLASKPAATVFFSLASKLVATVSPGLASKPVVGFLVEPQNQGGGGFPGLGLKTGSSGLVIWDSKSPQRFLGLDLKTMWASVCQLCHKTDGGRSVWDTRRDLAACFAWKHVWLGFPSLA
jgi:hypothetical protein